MYFKSNTNGYPTSKIVVAFKTNRFILFHLSAHSEKNIFNLKTYSKEILYITPKWHYLKLYSVYISRFKSRLSGLGSL